MFHNKSFKLNYDDDNRYGDANPLNIIISSLERNLNVSAKVDNGNLIGTLGHMHIKFKETFESLLQMQRIQDFDASQNYDTIRRRHSKTHRFIDYKFPTNESSVYFTNQFRDYLKQSNKFSGTKIKWVRAKDLVHNAHFAVDDQNLDANLNPINDRRLNESNYKKCFQTTDLDQGCIGNCWFIAGATGIIQNYQLLKKVIPFDNSFHDTVYTGAFHFRFWVNGLWKDVVVDDYLPVGPDNRLIFCKNKETPNEFWCALLEKAYAKLCGCYEALEGGFTSDALIDMSGGIEETYNLTSLRKSLLSMRVPRSTDQPTLDHKTFWNILVTARRKFSVIGCSIELTDKSRSEVRLKNGLVQGHAYIVTKIAELTLYNTDHRLLRLYNPWGNEVEWNGRWSDRSSSWYAVDNETKEKLELKIENDGEFWISYDDWLNNFDNCQICNLTPETIDDITAGDWQNSRLLSNIFSMWQCQYFHGRWTKGVSSGGCGLNSSEKYWQNPQYTFVINESDIIDDDQCWVIIGLLQKNTRQKRIALNVETAEEYIQFRLYKLRNSTNASKLLSNGSRVSGYDLERVNSSGPYTNKREVTGRFSLKTGVYIIIPSCYDEDVEGEFLIRIFTEKPLSKNECKCLTSSFEPHSSSNCSSHSEVDFMKKKLCGVSPGTSTVINNFIDIASQMAKNENADSSPRPSSLLALINGDEARIRPKLTPQISCAQS